MKLRLTLLAAVAATGLGMSVAHAADMMVGVAGPVTGEYAAFGDQMKNGAEQAVADINAAGGVLGKQLKLVIGDDACDPKQAVAAANDLVSKKVVFVDGHFCSASSIPASAVYADAGVLQITPASTNPMLTDDAAKKGWDNVFRTCGRDDAQGKFAGTWIAQHYKGQAVAIVQDKSTYGKGVADQTKKWMNANGLKEVMYEAITAGEKDYSALVSKLKAANVKAVYFGGYHPEAGLIVRQMREQGLNATLIAPDSMSTNEFWKITGSAGAGTMFTFPPDVTKLPESQAVVAEFKKKNINPEGYTLYTYAAMQVFAQAAKAAGSTDVDKLAKAIHGHTFNTVIGPLTYDNKGDVTNAKYVWYVFKNGTYSEM